MFDLFKSGSFCEDKLIEFGKRVANLRGVDSYAAEALVSSVYTYVLDDGFEGEKNWKTVVSLIKTDVRMLNVYFEQAVEKGNALLANEFWNIFNQFDEITRSNACAISSVIALSLSSPEDFI